MMTTLMLEIPVELVARLEREADRRQTSLAILVQEALQRTFPATEKGSASLSVHELTGQFCGSMQSGLGDLASNPKHLEKFGA